MNSEDKKIQRVLKKYGWDICFHKKVRIKCNKCAKRFFEKTVKTSKKK